MDFRIAPMAARGLRRRVRAVGRTTRRRIDAAGTLEAGGRAPPAFFVEDRRIDCTGTCADDTHENERGPRSELDGSGDGERRTRGSVVATG